MDISQVNSIEAAIDFFNEEIAGPMPTLNNPNAYIPPIMK